jgi:uncharacterized protein YdiU (UPF0061 family)
MFQPLKIHQGFHTLGPAYYSAVTPTPLSNPHWISTNTALAHQVGLDPKVFDKPEWLSLMSGQAVPNTITPIATVYSGHQFGFYNPQLGDGRALLLGELEDHNGKRWEMQLKGAGPTPFSRHADGRAVLRSSIREYLCGENLFGLGIPTTRALGLVGSPDPVLRESTESAAVVMRMSHSFVRFGHLEYFYHTKNNAALSALIDYVVERYYPEVAKDPNPILGFFSSLVKRTATTLAHWQAQGWCHGVMNTDNFSIIGDTIDYGPFGFLDNFDPAFVCNHSDTQGRYAFNQQPGIAHWNLAQVGQTLTDFVPVPELQAALDQFEGQFESAYHQIMCQKLGLPPADEAVNHALIRGWLELMQRNQWDYHWTFRRLAETHLDTPPTGLQALIIDTDNNVEAFDQWWRDYSQHCAGLQGNRQDTMLAANPWIVLRNWVAQEAIDAAEAGDFSLVQQLLVALQSPFEPHAHLQKYHDRPPASQAALVLSCSS